MYSYGDAAERKVLLSFNHIESVRPAIAALWVANYDNSGDDSVADAQFTVR